MYRPDSPDPVECLFGDRAPEFTKFREAIRNPEKADSGLKAILALFGTLYPIGSASIIARLPEAAFLRIEAETAAFLADYLPKLEREANKGPISDAKLLRELVRHQFNLVARECMPVSASVQEFEAQLRWDIAQFVCYRLIQYGWVTDAMALELDAGFMFFVVGAKPWATIPEADRDEVLHLSGRYADFAAVANRTGLQVGAITAQALSHLALRLREEALTRAVESGLKPAHADVTESSADQSRPTDAGPAVKKEDGGRPGPEPQFPKRAVWLKARLGERAWNKHDLARYRGPDHKTVQKVLDGFAVREEVLQKVADGLSKGKVHGKSVDVSVVDIPQD